MKNILKWNAEFAKNLWMEFSMQRLVAMPAILGLVIALVYTTADAEDVGKTIHGVAFAGFIAIGLLWGIKTSADAILDEYNEKTWDWQKMSIIGPWKLAIGKLFGSTSYNWYGALLCWVVFMLTAGSGRYPEDEIKTGIMLIIGMISLHGLMMLFSLQMVRKSDGRAKIKSNRIFILGIIFLMFLSPRLFMSHHELERTFSWYGIAYDSLIISAVFYCIWIVAGLYRSMRAELQFSDSPVWWLMFLLSNFIFQLGFFVDNEEFSALTGVAICLALVFFETLFLVYFLSLSEAKDVVNFRMLQNALKKKEYSSFFQNVPLWLITLPIAFIFGLLGVIVFSATPPDDGVLEMMSELKITYTWELILVLVAVIGFVIRDLAILLLLNFSSRSKRADMAMVVYLLLLYALLPGLTHELGIGAVFYPNVKMGVPAMIIFPLLEAGVAVFFLVQRWKSLDTVTE